METLRNFSDACAFIYRTLRNNWEWRSMCSIRLESHYCLGNFERWILLFVWKNKRTSSRHTYELYSICYVCVCFSLHWIFFIHEEAVCSTNIRIFRFDNKTLKDNSNQMFHEVQISIYWTHAFQRYKPEG